MWVGMIMDFEEEKRRKEKPKRRIMKSTIKKYHLPLNITKKKQHRSAKKKLKKK